MSLLFVVAVATFTLICTFFLLRTLLTPSDHWVEFEYLEDDLHAVQTLENHREKLVQQLRDLELDYSMNKLSDDDYLNYKKRFEGQAVAITKKIDSLLGGKSWKSRVDQALSSTTSSTTATTATTAPTVSSATQLICSCGQVIADNDKFCRSCGKKVGDITEHPTTDATDQVTP